MQARQNLAKSATEGYNALLRAEKFLGESGLDYKTKELVKLRVSQINGCAYCIDMHAHEAHEAGESLERLFAVAAWREAPYFTDAERAALELAEAATRMADTPEPVSDELWQRVAAHFDESQLAALTLGIALINAWNRISVISGSVAGSHRR